MIYIHFGILSKSPFRRKTGGMLEIPDANTKERDIVEEQKKRNKAKLDKKLKEQEGLVNSNQAVCPCSLFLVYL